MKGYSHARKCAYIKLPMDDIGSLKRALSHIDDPSARKTVIMTKWERGELSRLQACRLIRGLGLVEA